MGINYHEIPLSDLLQSKELKEYIKVADYFMNFIENFNSQNDQQFLNQCRKHLFEIYNVTEALPWVKLESNVSFDEQLDDKEVEKVNRFIEERLNKSRYYWHIYNPLDHKDDKVCGDLLDDLSDIYVDMKYSKMIYELDTEDCIENAVYQFKSLFDMHWGWHCTNAIYAIHYFLKGK